MKKASFLIALNFCLPIQSSEQDKATPTDEGSITTQSLSTTPHSPLDKNAQRPDLTSTMSIDSLARPTNETPTDAASSISQDFLIAQRNHQKFFARMEHEKEKFVAHQLAERNNTTFSRWERLNNKPERFKKEQETAYINFIKNLEDQIKLEQAKEYESLQQLIQQEIQERKITRSPISTKKLNQQNQDRIKEMEERHQIELFKIAQQPEPSVQEKLKDFWGK